MTVKADLIPYLFVWFLAIVLIIRESWKTSGAGLMLAYAFQMLMLYWVGACMHAFPWGDLEASDWSLEVVHLGLQQSTNAIVAFAVGALLLGPLVASTLSNRRR